MQDTPPAIQRHKTAIRRASFSLPVKCALRDGLIDGTRTLFDFGCGRGQDLELLQGQGVACSGWDPVHRPEVGKRTADLVNLGYVINVIEDPAERSTVLREAWDLCRDVLVVAAQVEFGAREHRIQYSDGVLSSRGTFQKYYSQAELRGFLEEAVGTTPIPAAPGVFYLFKDETARQALLARRYRRSIAAPRRRVSELLYEEHQELLQPLLEALTQLGRLPDLDELPEAAVIIDRLGSMKRAFRILQRVFGAETWVAISKSRAEDLLVYLALARFGKRPVLSRLPQGTQRDVKAFYGTYSEACRRADELLFSVADASAVDSACQRAPVGLLVENARVVRRSDLDQLEPLLRVYEGCARALVGEIEGVNVVKLHRYSGKVSYLAYSAPGTGSQPELQFRVKVALRTLRIDHFDHSRTATAPA